MDEATAQRLLPMRAATENTWKEVFPDAPLLLHASDEHFQGYRVHGTELGIGLFDGEWVLAFIAKNGADFTLSQGPFDFAEQAVAALLAQVAGSRAMRFLGGES